MAKSLFPMETESTRCLGCHVMDLAVACGVEHLVTHNVRDFQHGELHFSLPEVVTPLQHLEKNR